MRKVLQMTFAGENAELLAVENGEQALARGRQFQPNVVFVDSSLPDIDGYELVRAIKADSELAGTPVVLMASQQNPYDESRGANAGVDAHILKPFDSQEAIDKAYQLAGGLSAASQVPSAAPPSARPMPPPLPSQAPSAPAAAPSSMAPAPVSSIPAAAAASVAPLPMTGGNGAAGSVADRLVALGLTQAQVEGVLKLSAEVVERVVWEVVPDLAEAMIREELHRLTGE